MKPKKTLHLIVKRNWNVGITTEGRSEQLAGNSEVPYVAENPKKSNNAAFYVGYLGIWGWLVGQTLSSETENDAIMHLKVFHFFLIVLDLPMRGMRAE